MKNKTIAQTSNNRFRKFVTVAFSSLLLASLLIFVMTAMADRNASTPSSPFGGSCVGLDVTNTSDSGAGSLRQAITDANTNPGLDTICFNIASAGVQTIAPLSALPIITSPVVIDGYSQPGASANTLAVGSDATLLIELNGTSAGPAVNGLTISAGGSTVRGMVINRFSNVGIALATSGANTVQGNHIGTNAAGTANLNNGNVGVFINGTPNNLIGGPAPAARNILSGNVYGVYMTAAGATGNMVQGNYIGMDKSGAVALGNAFDGVLLQTGPGSNTIGGTDSGAGNVISGNTFDGVSLFGANNNTVQGNLIGTDATGTLDRGNARYGVRILGGASGNIIGGNVSGARNVISGNALDGINISESSNNNTIQGNHIGTNAAGTAAIGNTQSGIRLDGPVANTTIGGTSASERNVISGNNQFGVDLFAGTITGTTIQGNFIGTNAAGNAALGNTTSGIRLRAGGISTLTIGGTTATTPFGACTGACNLISGNTASGIEQSAAGGASVIQGNYIGTDVSGTIDLGNASIGIDLNSNALGNTIGGMIPAARNVISGNNGIGVNLGGAGGHTLHGNYIGLNSAGAAALGNSGNGVSISSSGNTVGGTAAGAGNVISGHNSGASPAGVQINASTNTVQGNFIGTNATGTTAFGNRTGIFIANNSTGALIGGATPGAGNVISGNTTDGIFIGRNGPAFTTSNNNTVQGNFIGTTADGTADLGNAGNGVVLRDSNGNTIGGATAGQRNVISGNNASGVLIDRQDTGSTGNMIRGNYIGTNSAGTGALGNSAAGVFIESSSNNTIGGPAAGQGNVIAFNSGDGVFVNSVTGNAIRANSIFSNNDLGIDLSPDGVTANDANDPDTGANNRQNFPVLTEATTGGGNANILGTLDTALPNTAFTVEFFSSDSCNAATPNDFGEGQTLIHTATLTTDASGDAGFNQTFASPLSGGKFVTATATDPAGNTSEFSQCRQAEQVTISVNDVTVAEGNSGPTNAGFTVSISRTRGVDVVVSYTTADNTATDADNDYEPAAGSVTITAGATTAPINTAVNGDNKFELNDTFFLNFTATNADIADAQGVGTITNDDQQPTININDVSDTEGHTGTKNFTFTVSLSAASGVQASVTYSTANGNAQAGSDYATASESLVFAPGETSKPVVVQVNGDTDNELNESFFLNLSGESGASLADSQGQGMIMNDDGPTAAPAVVAGQITIANGTPLGGVVVTLTGGQELRRAITDARGNYLFTNVDTDGFYTVTPKRANYLFAPTERSFSLLADKTDAVFSGVRAGETDNALDTPEFFVRQHYLDFLNREPDQAGLDFWSNQIRECDARAVSERQSCGEVRRVNVSAAFFLSIEFQRTGYLVHRFEKASFNRLASYASFTSDARRVGEGIIVGDGDWQARLETNSQAFAEEWAARAEFRAIYDAKTNAEYVDALFANAGATPSVDERAALINGLASGAETRATVLRKVAENADVARAQFSPAFVYMQYAGYLRRNPEEAPDLNLDGYNFWLAKLNQFNGDFQQAEMVKSFILSGEYRGRFK